MISHVFDEPGSTTLYQPSEAEKKCGESNRSLELVMCQVVQYTFGQFAARQNATNQFVALGRMCKLSELTTFPKGVKPSGVTPAL